MSLTSWRFEGSNDDATYTTLYTSVSNIVGTPAAATMNEFIITPTPTTSYAYYRFYVVTSTGTNVGLCQFQIFSVDQLF